MMRWCGRVWSTLTVSARSTSLGISRWLVLGPLTLLEDIQKTKESGRRWKTDAESHARNPKRAVLFLPVSRKTVTWPWLCNCKRKRTSGTGRTKPVDGASRTYPASTLSSKAATPTATSGADRGHRAQTASRLRAAALTASASPYRPHYGYRRSRRGRRGYRRSRSARLCPREHATSPRQIDRITVATRHPPMSRLRTTNHLCPRWDTRAMLAALRTDLRWRPARARPVCLRTGDSDRRASRWRLGRRRWLRQRELGREEGLLAGPRIAIVL